MKSLVKILAIPAVLMAGCSNNSNNAYQDELKARTDCNCNQDIYTDEWKNLSLDFISEMLADKALVKKEHPAYTAISQVRQGEEGTLEAIEFLRDYGENIKDKKVSDSYYSILNDLEKNYKHNQKNK